MKKTLLLVLVISMFRGAFPEDGRESLRDPGLAWILSMCGLATPAAGWGGGEWTSAQRNDLAAWGAGTKRYYVERSTELENRIEERTAGGYVYGSTSLSRAKSALSALDRAIDRDEWSNVPGLYEEAQEAVRLFEAGCRWREGERHRRFPHIRSAAREGYWNADSGWLFVQQGSLEVVRICPNCNGSKVETVWVTCARCNGTGRVETPLGGLTRALDDLRKGVEAVDNLGRAFNGKPPNRGGGGGPRGNGSIPCNGCNQRGKVQRQQPCSRCNGTGYVK